MPGTSSQADVTLGSDMLVLYWLDAGIWLDVRFIFLLASLMLSKYDARHVFKIDA